MGIFLLFLCNFPNWKVPVLWSKPSLQPPDKGKVKGKGTKPQPPAPRQTLGKAGTKDQGKGKGKGNQATKGVFPSRQSAIRPVFLVLPSAMCLFLFLFLTQHTHTTCNTQNMQIAQIMQNTQIFGFWSLVSGVYSLML